MNINIYLEDALAKSLNQCVPQMGQSRNAIIREAIKEWIIRHEIKKWPISILKFQGVQNAIAFESYREDYCHRNGSRVALGQGLRRC